MKYPRFYRGESHRRSGILGSAPRAETADRAPPVQAGMKRLATILALVLAGAGCDEGQQGDRSFQPRVERPAYTESHPAVLYEDGHKTPHTSKDKYRAFVELLRKDGYSVRSHQGEFTSPALEKARVLVIVNAGGTEKAGEHFPAFTARNAT